MLRAGLEESSYNAHVTPDELWRAVGEILLVQRTRKQWNHSDVERHGGPNYKTVGSIERGKIGNLQKLTRHAEALGLSVVDVLRTALRSTSKPLTPEADTLLRRFGQIGVKGRGVLLSMAQVLPDADEEERQARRQSLGEPPGKDPRKH